MTAAYRLKGIGWFAIVVGVALAFYLVSLRVAAERKRLDETNTRVLAAERDIRALETEFDTRANLAQLEKWNGDTLSLAAPTAGQFVRDDAQLAALDPGAAAGPLGANVKTAALVVPSQPMTPPMIEAAATPTVIRAVAVMAVAPTGRAAPALARLAEAARGQIAIARVRPQAVAMLDRKLLSDHTFGDIMASARAEARRN